MSALVKTMENIVEIERLSLRWVARRRSPLVNWLMRGLTRAGDWQTWTVLILAALTVGGNFREIALQITPRLLLTLGICFTKAMQVFSSLLTDPDPYSFPSSHSACAWVVCISLAMILGGWPTWIIYAAAISYSRIHIGAHYPLDVLIGSCLGIVLALL